MTRVSDGEGTFGNPYGWRAPEAGGDLYALATVDDVRLAVWGHSAAGWRLVRTLTSPEAAFPYLGSPEPFVANGRSYVSLVVANAPMRSREAPNNASGS